MQKENLTRNFLNCGAHRAQVHIHFSSAPRRELTQGMARLHFLDLILHVDEEVLWSDAMGSGTAISRSACEQ